MDNDETRPVKVHRVTLLIVDHDELGAAGTAVELENARFANDCIAPSVLDVETREVQWHDGHPLNKLTTRLAAVDKLFAKEPT